MAELDRRVAISDQLEPLVSAVQDDERFGGLYIDQADGGRIHIGITRRDAAFSTLVGDLLPAGASYSLDLVQFNDAALRALRMTIEKDLSSLAEEFGVRHLNIDPRANRVEIGIRPYSSDAAAALVSRYGASVKVVASG